MQQQDSSQATSTLGNTPNLHIGSYPKGNNYIVSQTGIPILVHQTGTSTLVPKPGLLQAYTGTYL